MMDQQLGNFFTNRKHALNNYISCIIASIYGWAHGKSFHDLAIGPKLKKNKTIFELLTHQICSVLPGDTGGYLSLNILTPGCSLFE